MNKEQWIDKTEEGLLHVYDRYDVVLDHGEGVYLYDTDGKKYLDFASGIGVMGLGYGYPEWVDALRDQVGKVTHVSNLFYHTEAMEAASLLLEASGMEKAFFTNSGTEAIEGAIKAARKYAYTKRGRAGGEIIAFENSFHGRTIGALSVTGTQHYREPFEPLMPGVRFAEYNDIESVKKQIGPDTIAVMVEMVQGEGGVMPASGEFAKGLKQIQDSGILIICDEVQCGMGRTGKMFAYQWYGLEPDIVTCAKALGCGVPVGAFLLNEKTAASSLTPGDHGTTYGGNPLALRAVKTVFNIFKDKDILSHVAEMGDYLGETLENLAKKHEEITGVRGKGLMRGLAFRESPAGTVKKCIENGLIVITAGGNVLRMLPPLVIEKDHIDEMAAVLEKVL